MARPLSRVEGHRALLRHGPDHVTTLVDALRAWMAGRGYASVEQLTGSMSQVSVRDPSLFERANYLEAMTTGHLGLV